MEFERIAAIMAEPVANKLLQRARLAEQTQHGVGNRDAVGLTACADVVVHAGIAVAQRAIDAASVVLDVEVVANRAAITVDRQGPIVDRIGDEERDDLFGVLIRAIRVRAAGDDRRQAVRRPIGLDLELPARLARAVRAARMERIAFDAQPAVDLAVDLVGAHLEESIMPVFARRVHEHEGAVDVGQDELTRCLERPIDV